MHVIFMLNENVATKVLHGDIVSDVVMMWDARHDVIIKKA